MTPWSPHDLRYMKRAIELAARGSLFVRPNPQVGCVIVSPQNEIIGSGWHRSFGDRHAEVEAFESVAPSKQHLLSRSTWYVTLEPCSHHGKTPPCADLICQIKPARVVIAVEDPNPSVDGQGVHQMRKQGIHVDVGCLRDEATWQNRRFFHALKYKRPWVVLKWAESMDGFMDPRKAEDRIAKSGGRAITGREAGLVTHGWRASEMGILVGANTAIIDEPQLDVRHVAGGNPLRFILDPNRRVPPNHPLFSSSDGQEPAIQISSTHDIGSSPLSSWNWHPKEGLTVLLERLNAYHQLDSILIEGGAFTLKSFLNEDIWDEIKRWKTPSILGNGLASPALPQELVQPPFGPSRGFAGNDEWQRCIHPRFSTDHLRL